MKNTRSDQVENEIKVTFSIVKVTVMSIVLTIIFIILAGFLHQFFHGELNVIFNIWDILLFSASYFLFIVLHEFFHLLGFRIAGKVPWRELAWGVDLKKGIAYAHSRKKIRVKEMRAALILPFYVTGLLPFVLGIGLNSIFLSLLGAFLMGGCTGDFAFIYKLRKFPPDAMVKDHPTEPQFLVNLQ